MSAYDQLARAEARIADTIDDLAAIERLAREAGARADACTDGNWHGLVRDQRAIQTPHTAFGWILASSESNLIVAEVPSHVVNHGKAAADLDLLADSKRCVKNQAETILRLVADVRFLRGLVRDQHGGTAQYEAGRLRGIEEALAAVRGIDADEYDQCDGYRQVPIAAVEALLRK